ncbi:hypothetical protein EMCRGX_G028657 [Ephydatia muelleri]
MWIYTIPAAASFILTLVSFWYNQPTIPPAPTANTHSAALGDFFRGIWSEQSGLWAALTIFVGVTGAIIASLILDYTKLFKEVGVISFGLAVLCFVWFIEVSRLYDQSVNVVISLCVFGFFALPLVPVCMELGVEITYPVAEATSSGLLWSSVQISSVVLVLLSNILQTDLPEEQISRSTCHLEVLSVSSCIVANSTSPVDPTEHPKDMTNVMLVYMFLAAAVFLYMVLWFKPQYKRSDADRNNEVCYKALKPVGCFQTTQSKSVVDKLISKDSRSTNFLHTVETTYQTADLYSTYLESESDES